MNGNPKWKVIKVYKREHLTIWKVQRHVHGKKEIGFFKFTKPNHEKYIGPLVANELICNRLAKAIGLPVAKTTVTTINGRRGIISLKMSNNRLRRWDHVITPKNVFNTVVSPRRLYKTLVFDIWICNIDRSGKNIMVYPTSQKYDFYLIDHELALLGAIRYENKRWNSAYWDDVSKCTHGYHPVLLRYMKNYAVLAPYVRRIQNIQPETIRSVLNSISPDFLSVQDKMLTEKLLLRRQRRLARIVSKSIS